MNGQRTASPPDPKTNSFVIHYRGQPVPTQRRSGAEAVGIAKPSKDVPPHVLQHTAVTWMFLAENAPYDVANLVGMSLKMLDEVYGHRRPDHQRDIAARIGRR